MSSGSIWVNFSQLACELHQRFQFCYREKFVMNIWATIKVKIGPRQFGSKNTPNGPQEGYFWSFWLPRTLPNFLSRCKKTSEQGSPISQRIQSLEWYTHSHLWCYWGWHGQYDVIYLLKGMTKSLLCSVLKVSWLLARQMVFDRKFTRLTHLLSFASSFVWRYSAKTVVWDAGYDKAHIVCTSSCWKSC